jgi:hypothetical protein
LVDRLEGHATVVREILGNEHALRDLPGVAAGDEMVESLALACAQI